MTGPGDITFEGAPNVAAIAAASGSAPIDPTSLDTSAQVVPSGDVYPAPILKGISEENLNSLKWWLDRWIYELEADQGNRQKAWDDIEQAYASKDDGTISTPPFVGGCMDVIPVIGMAVDPIHARLDTGIFKQDTIFTVKPLRADVAKMAPSLESFLQFYHQHKSKLRRVASPRILECCKLGTMIFKVVQEKITRKVKTYDEAFNVIPKDQTVFSGPRVYGISIGDLLFPPGYQDIQDCPIVVERQKTTLEKLQILQNSKKLTNVDPTKLQILPRSATETELEASREKAADHQPGVFQQELVVYEAWFDYDIDGDGQPERMIATYERRSRTLLQLRYNWFFHQRHPYVVIPYTVTNESLYGLGIGAMTLPFQKAITRFHRMAQDNAYLANIRMFIGRKNSGIEDVPKLYTGKVFLVDDPGKDFIPFAAAEIYPSTLSERQNLFGMVEKRTGVSDYLTGRESPIIGSRATATSTLALIREGMARVEEVLENLRVGFAEINEFCISLWIQYGTDNLETQVFGDDQIAQDVKAFFKLVGHDNVNGMFAFELTCTDPMASRPQMQQMQLQIIQVMMGYLEKVLQLGQAALQAEAQSPQFVAMAKDVMSAAKNLFSDLLKKYDIPNPDDYLPDLEKYLNGGPGADVAGQGSIPGAGGQAGGAPGSGVLPFAPRTLPVPAVPMPAAPGSGVRPVGAPAVAGPGTGNPQVY